MNVQGLIEKYRKFEDGLFDIGAKVACQNFLKDLEQLEEPQPVKVPQFVADWIKHSKNRGRSLFGAMSIFEENTEIKEFMQWADNQETFALAWILGYEVEKEKRYRVKVKGMNEECEYLVFGELSNTWKFRGLNEFGELKKHHTRKELEDSNFGWVFDCPGIEIEEVGE